MKLLDMFVDAMRAGCRWQVMAMLLVVGAVPAVQAEWASATGGTSTNDVVIGSQIWRVHTFEDVGSSTLDVTQAGNLEYLIVGGGGGGNGMRGGGGGGGAVVTNAFTADAIEYTIVVGDGGGPGANGVASTAFDITAGGGGAGGVNATVGSSGTDGSSGGGGGYQTGTGVGDGPATLGGEGDSPGTDGGQGYKDGPWPGSAGGGGGAGGAGEAASPDLAGDGGVGVEVWGARYAGGGGGGARYENIGGNGKDGGGDGGWGETTLDHTPDGGEDGDPNTGAGGGGAGGGGNVPEGGDGRAPAGKGGSGIVIVRYVVGEVTMQVLYAGEEVPVDSTAFIQTEVDTPVSREYVVTNLNSSADLILTNTPYAVVFEESGTTNCNGFTISSNIEGAATNIAPGESASFTITFVASMAGSYTGTVSIANSDPAKDPYTFVVTADATLLKSVDGIVGISQASGPSPGYYIDSAGVDARLAGVTGSNDNTNRYCKVPVVGFALPTLPEGQILESVTIRYNITSTRSHSGTDFDAHVYLLDSADPSDTGDMFYYQGGSDPNEDVVFVGASDLPHDGTGTIPHDPPLVFSHMLSGAALSLFQGFYDGETPLRSEAFFRFNRSNATVLGSHLDRFMIGVAPTVLSLEITTVDPAPSMQVLHEGVEIAVAGTDEWVATAADFSVERTYVVTNLSSAAANLLLTGDPVVVFAEGGTSHNGFSITSNIGAGSANLATGESASFTIAFAQSVAGSYSATVSIANNDPGKNPYTFIVEIDVLADPVPAMAVYDGGSLVETNSVQALGFVALDATGSKTFTVTNSASAQGNLLLTNATAAVVFGNGTTSQNGFTITSNIEGASTNIAPGGSSSFTVQFSANTHGSYLATVRIANNDPDKDPYTFEVMAYTQVYMLESHPFNHPAGWDDTDAKYWSDGFPPSAGKDYLVASNRDVWTPNGSSAQTFPGDSLTLGNASSWGQLGLNRSGTGNRTTVVNNLQIVNGRIITTNQSTVHTLQTGSGEISVENALRIRSRVNHTSTAGIAIDATLTGTDVDLIAEGRIELSTGNNEIRLQRANTISGSIRVIGYGKLMVNHADAIQNLTLDLRSGEAGTVHFAQNSTVGGLMGSRNIDLLTRVISVGNNNEDTTYSGQLSNGGLTKIGTGSLTLSGANPYTGATAVSGGTLRINGSTAEGSAVTVNNGGTLAGNGTVEGSLTIQSGGTFLADGTALTVGALTLNSGSILDLSGITLAGDAVELMNYASLSETFSTVAVPAGWLLHYSYQGSDTIALVRPMPSVFRFR